MSDYFMSFREIVREVSAAVVTALGWVFVALLWPFHAAGRAANEFVYWYEKTVVRPARHWRDSGGNKV